MEKKFLEDLKYKSKFGKNFGKYQEGYRIVYFYSDNTYKVGTFCGDINGFMMDFVKIEPIENENDIPKFVSIDDLLERYLTVIKDATRVQDFELFFKFLNTN